MGGAIGDLQVPQRTTSVRREQLPSTHACVSIIAKRKASQFRTLGSSIFYSPAFEVTKSAVRCRLKTPWLTNSATPAASTAAHSPRVPNTSTANMSTRAQVRLRVPSPKTPLAAGAHQDGAAAVSHRESEGHLKSTCLSDYLCYLHHQTNLVHKWIGRTFFLSNG